MVVGHGGAAMAQIAKVFIEGFLVEFLVLMGGVESSELHIQWTGDWGIYRPSRWPAQPRVGQGGAGQGGTELG